MKSFKKFLAEENTTLAYTTNETPRHNTELKEYKPGSPEFQDRIREILPNFFDDEKPKERPAYGPNSLTPEEIEIIEDGEPQVEDYEDPLDWLDSLVRYWRLYFQYFGMYQDSPDMAEQIAQDAYDRWYDKWSEQDDQLFYEAWYLQRYPIPERENYSSDEEYQKAFDEWVEQYEELRNA